MMVRQSHNYFISYKHSDACNLRDDINGKLKSSGYFNHGETDDSKDLSGKSEEYIKSVLKDPFFNTSITLVIISPNMKESQWIPWEIEYSIKYVNRETCTSHPNGIIGIIQKFHNSYSWFMSSGIGYIANNGKYNLNYLPYIIRANINNLKQTGLVHNALSQENLSNSYIDIYYQDDFLINYKKYIHSAFIKAQNESYYDLIKSESKAREKILICKGQSFVKNFF